MTPLEVVKGLVRPFIAVSFVLTAVGLFAFGKLDAKEVLGIVSFITGFYFGERSAKNGGTVTTDQPRA